MRIIGAGVVAVLVAILLFFVRPAAVLDLDNRVCDVLTRWAGPGKQTGRVMVVEIDDKSVARHGRWPWPRELTGRLVERVAANNPSEIVLDMMFPQEANAAGGPVDDGLAAANDRALASALAAKPAVVGYSLRLEGGGDISSECDVPSLPLALADSGGFATAPFFRASGALCNAPLISRAAAASGFLNATPDSDGKVRRLPLLIESAGRFYPSLALAALIAYRHVRTVELTADSNGAARLRLDGRVIPLEGQSLARLRFRGARRSFPNVSAADVLSGAVPPGALRGKIALVGGTALGLWSPVVAPVDALYPAVEVQATAIDNLLQGDVLARPGGGWVWELLLGLLAGLGCTVLLARVRSPWAPAGALGLGVAAPVGSALLLRSTGVLLSPLPAAVALACASVVVIVLNSRRARRTAERAERQLDSARELTREVREEGESRYRRLVENISDAIVVYDVEGRIEFANSRLREWFGLTEEDIHTVTLERYVAPEWRAEWRARHNRRVRGEAVPGQFEFEGLRADGTRMWIEAIVTTVTENGRIAGTQAALRDTTARKRLEAEYLQAQKMEIVGRLAGGVAHDFNNLLQVISGYGELAMQDLPPSHPSYSSLEQIRMAGERAAELTQKLLAFGRKQVAQPRAFELNVVVAEAERMFSRLAGGGIQIEARLDPAAGQVMADSGQISQVLMNLLVNARDSMPAGGSIVIETGNVEVTGEEAAEGARSGLAAGWYVHIGVTDTGTGMTDEVKQRLFEPFFTTKEPGKGTGLGLATAYAIIRQSGGAITVASEVGRGTAFHVYLPRLEAGMADAAGASAPVAVPGGSETVLIVEDQDAVRQLASAWLARLGYRVLEASNGPEAIELARRYPGQIDLLLTDVILPLMNGQALAEELLRTRPGIKALYVSGYAGAVVDHGGMPEGDWAFLAKPFSREALAAKVREVLAGPARSRLGRPIP
jgi:PAS domain S-box-containing protein